MKETWICSRDAMFPGKEVVLRRTVNHINHMTAVAGWKNLWVSTGQGHALFCTESTLKQWTSARAAFQGSCLSLSCSTCSEWAEGQMLQQGWTYWLFPILWCEFEDSCILLKHLLPKIRYARPSDPLFWIEGLVLCTQIALAVRSVVLEHSGNEWKFGALWPM